MGYSNSEVSHLWASGNKREAKSNNGNFYFTNDTIYSYGGHFPVGIIVRPATVFLNSDSYSMTTSQHKSIAAGATRHMQRFYFPKLASWEPAISQVAAHRRVPRKGNELRVMRQRIERDFQSYMRDHPDAPRDGWQWILDQVGIGNRFALIERKAARLQARTDAKVAANALAVRRRDGRLYGDMADSVFRAIVQSHRYAENGYAGRRSLADMSVQIAAAHKQAKADGFSRRTKILWKRLQMVRATIKEMDSIGVGYNHGRLAKVIRAVADIRHMGELISDIPSPTYKRAAASAACLLAGHMPPAIRARLAAYQETMVAAYEARLREEEAERFARQAAERAAWLAGQHVASSRSLTDEMGGALIRAHDVEIDGCTVKGGELETSQGARVPLTHAVRIFHFVRRLRERGEDWTADPARPVRVGYYQLDAVTANGNFRAGCHTINWGEIERLARELGIWDCPATGEAE